jgi:hypothetical protein
VDHRPLSVIDDQRFNYGEVDGGDLGVDWEDAGSYGGRCAASGGWLVR